MAKWTTGFTLFIIAWVAGDSYNDAQDDIARYRLINSGG